jgi:hypothetical protein
MSADNLLALIPGKDGTCALYNCGFSSVSCLPGWGIDSLAWQVCRDIARTDKPLSTHPTHAAALAAAEDLAVDPYFILEYGIIDLTNPQPFSVRAAARCS